MWEIFGNIAAVLGVLAFGYLVYTKIAGKKFFANPFSGGSGKITGSVKRK